MATWRGYTITQAFGVKNSNYRLGYHPGTDFRFALGSHQPAFASGIARYQKDKGGGYGNTGTITLPNGDVIFYAHLQEGGILVPSGSQVKDGQSVFVTGNTGWIDGVHAHIEYRIGGNQDSPVDITKKLGGTMSDKWDINNARQIAYSFWGRDGRGGRPNAIIGQSDDDLNKYHVGKADLSNSNITSAWDAPEAQSYRKELDRVYAEAAKVPELEKQLAAKPKEIIKEIRVDNPEHIEKIRELEEQLAEKPKEVVKEVPGKSIVVDPTYYPAGDLFRALLQKAVAWFNKK